MKARLPPQSLPMQLLIPIIVYIAILSLRAAFPALSQMVTFVAFYVALGLAYNIFQGMTNYVNFGYVAFLGLGMYGTAQFVKSLYHVLANLGDTGLKVLVIIAGGAAVSMLLSLIMATIVGLIALRLRQVYFAISTIGLAMGLRYFIEGAGLWGGSEGTIIAEDLLRLLGAPGVVGIVELADIMFAVVGILAVLITYRILTSKWQYALAALREDEDAADVFGINTTRCKFIVFIVSAILAAILGCAMALKYQAIYPPEAFALTYTIESIVIIMFGGAGTLLGPIIGGIIYSILKYVLTVIAPGLQLLVIAPVMILIIMFFPTGFVGWLRNRVRAPLIRRLII